MTTPNDMKRAAARAAIAHLPVGELVGVGTGSTANHFIDALGERRADFPKAVASSIRSAERLASNGITVVDLNEVEGISCYVDGADEADGARCLIKGGGGALTREKIVAEASIRFICIADESKLVEQLGAFPLPVEVIPMAASQIQRSLIALGGDPVLREGFTTDNGNVIIDIHGLTISDPVGLERTINQIPGVVTNGLFARRPADLLLFGRSDGSVVEI